MRVWGWGWVVDNYPHPHPPYGDGNKHIGVTSDFTLKVIEHVHGVTNRYIKEDVQLDGTIDKLIVKSSNVAIDSSDIINDRVNELDVFIGEMEDEYEEEKKWKMSVARNTTGSTLLYRHTISFC